MNTSEKLKSIVKEKYSAIANSTTSSCCGDSCGTAEVYNIMTDDHTNIKGYKADMLCLSLTLIICLKIIPN